MYATSATGDRCHESRSPLRGGQRELPSGPLLSTQRVPYGIVKLVLIAAHVECCRGAERIWPLPRREWSAVRVMEDWSPPFPGFFLSYPSRKHHPAAIAALIETRRV